MVADFRSGLMRARLLLAGAVQAERPPLDQICAEFARPPGIPGMSPIACCSNCVL